MTRQLRKNPEKSRDCSFRSPRPFILTIVLGKCAHCRNATRSTAEMCSISRVTAVDERVGITVDERVGASAKKNSPVWPS